MGLKTLPNDEPTEELMPMLTALRKAKLRVELNGESARVSFRKGEARSVEAYDLVYEYARTEGIEPSQSVLETNSPNLGTFVRSSPFCFWACNSNTLPAARV